MALLLTSPAFREGERIPRRHSCDGEDLSPALRWSGAPAGTAGFALIMEDPDAPAGTWVHWVLQGLPAAVDGLPEGVPTEARLPDGSLQGPSWGVLTYSRTGYHGPCPPPGPPHRYVFELHALDATLPQAAGLCAADLRRAMAGHVLERARLIGTYGRQQPE